MLTVLQASVWHNTSLVSYIFILPNYLNLLPGSQQPPDSGAAAARDSCSIDARNI